MVARRLAHEGNVPPIAPNPQVAQPTSGSHRSQRRSRCREVRDGDPVWRERGGPRPGSPCLHRSLEINTASETQAKYSTR